ncbi:MAG: glycerol-3-phosphate dehydrogenase/oxidase [Deltaproteobacteria bacterium]|nr:glycerol-3-phosphate dehydrogenase/oxidase [Deltaproteobacteria bacterium]MBW2719058.1 glycerol-3-phosphate dehydrogenase/oxidase [Deltaproteobacteria bacterium]
MPSREEMWRKIPDEVDLIVIGGGITGAGVVRNAARRGLRVALFDQKDFAAGTSSKSSKLIHGGLRYLETYEFSLVFESVSERRVMLDLAPHLVNPLAFLFPVYAGSRRNLRMIKAGMWLYAGLSLFRSPKRHQVLNAAEVAEAEPLLKQEGLQGAPLYYDCSTDDSRLVLENVLDGIENGGLAVSWARVDALIKDEQGRVSGVVVKNTRDGSVREVKANAIINATGPWTDEVLGLSGPRTEDMLRLTKGIHIVVDREKLPVEHAVVLFHPDDDRVLFALPWGERTYIGTTDTDYEGAPGEEAATLADVDYCIAAANEHFPTQQISRDDVIATWAGLRPLISPPEEMDDVAESKVSREHQITVGRDGLITIAGGKLTTYRKMAKEVVDVAVHLLKLSDGLPEDLHSAQTFKAPLPGAVGWPAHDDHALVAEELAKVCECDLPKDVALHLVDTYGMRAVQVAKLCAKDPALLEPIVPGRVEIMAQVDFGVQEELAASVSDILIRRTQILFRDFDQGLGAADKVANRLAELIGWSAEEKQKSIDYYKSEVALSRQWKKAL